MKNISKIVGGLVVVVLISLGISIAVYHTKAPETVQNTTLGGGDVRNVGEVATNGQGFGNLPVTVNFDGGKIFAKTNTAFWKNTTGRTIYVNSLEVSTDGTASSTYSVYAYATTSAPRTLYDFVAPTQTNTNGTLLLINNFSFATSSAATTTSNIDKAFAGKTVRVLPNSYVNIVLQQPGAACNGATCETATSTNRGFNLQWRIGYHD